MDIESATRLLLQTRMPKNGMLAPASIGWHETDGPSFQVALNHTRTMDALKVSANIQRQLGYQMTMFSYRGVMGHAPDLPTLLSDPTAVPVLGCFGIDSDGLECWWVADASMDDFGVETIGEPLMVDLSINSEFTRAVRHGWTSNVPWPATDWLEAWLTENGHVIHRLLPGTPPSGRPVQ